MQQWTADSPCIYLQGKLLEGPFYDETTRECRFIDIVEQKLHTYNVDDGQKSLRTVHVKDPLSVTANIKGLPSSSSFVVGARYGVATIDAKTGELKYICKMWNDDRDGAGKQELMRCNDGAVDSHGRFWIGSMVDPERAGEERPEGVLFRLDADLSLHRILFGVQSPNGTAWNAADTIMYWTDSGQRTIYAFDFDAPTGTISNRREYWNAERAGFPDGVNPDGLVIDEEDCIWTALWRGFKVLRLNHEGLTIGEVTLPTAYVTCPVFAGTKLVITTARDPTINEEGPKRGGDVYQVDVGVRGARKHEFALPTSTDVA